MKHISNNFLQILNINIIAILVLPPYMIFYNILPLETPQTLASLRKEKFCINIQKLINQSPNCNIKYHPHPPLKKAPQNPLSLKTYRRGVEPVGGLDGLWTFQVRIEIQVPGRKIHIAVDLFSPLSLVHKPAMHAHVHVHLHHKILLLVLSVKVNVLKFVYFSWHE